MKQRLGFILLLGQPSTVLIHLGITLMIEEVLVVCMKKMANKTHTAFGEKHL